LQKQVSKNKHQARRDLGSLKEQRQFQGALQVSDKECKRNEAFDQARQQYAEALRAVLGDSPPDVNKLIEKHGIAFALRVLEARRINDNA